MEFALSFNCLGLERKFYSAISFNAVLCVSFPPFVPLCYLFIQAVFQDPKKLISNVGNVSMMADQRAAGRVSRPSGHLSNPRRAAKLLFCNASHGHGVSLYHLAHQDCLPR